MCCGRFGDVAKLPSFPASKGPDVFDGRVLHALDYSALDSKSTRELIQGKKVVVVGFQKTSLDIAVEVAEINEGELDRYSLCSNVHLDSLFLIRQLILSRLMGENECHLESCG